MPTVRKSASTRNWMLLAGALIWGLVELIALYRSRLLERPRTGA